jgi:hypothetical protein
MQKFAQDKQKTLEVVSKPQVRLKSKAQTDPPSLKKLWRDR